MTAAANSSSDSSIMGLQLPATGSTGDGSALRVPSVNHPSRGVLDTSRAPETFPNDLWKRTVCAMKSRVVTRVLLAVTTVAVAGCGSGGPADRSGEIASKIGASSCVATDYEVVMRIDNSKRRIYDCDVNGKRMCVTEENGIASDSTATVKLLFATALGGQKPSCI